MRTHHHRRRRRLSHSPPRRIARARTYMRAYVPRACGAIERAGAVYTVDNGGQESEGRTCVTESPRVRYWLSAVHIKCDRGPSTGTPRSAQYVALLRSPLLASSMFPGSPPPRRRYLGVLRQDRNPFVRVSYYDVLA